MINLRLVTLAWVAAVVAAMLFAMTLYGCGPGPLFVTPNYGIEVYIGNNVDGGPGLSWPSPYDVDRAVELVLQEADALGQWPYRRKATERALRDDPPVLFVRPVAFDCWVGRCSGTYDPGLNEIVAESGRCFARSALGHELIHWLHHRAGGISLTPDDDHNKPGWWRGGVESAARARHVAELCPEGS